MIKSLKLKFKAQFNTLACLLEWEGMYKKWVTDLRQFKLQIPLLSTTIKWNCIDGSWAWSVHFTKPYRQLMIRFDLICVYLHREKNLYVKMTMLNDTGDVIARLSVYIHAFSPYLQDKQTVILHQGRHSAFLLRVTQKFIMFFAVFQCCTKQGNIIYSLQCY